MRCHEDKGDEHSPVPFWSRQQEPRDWDKLEAALVFSRLVYECSRLLLYGVGGLLCYFMSLCL